MDPEAILAAIEQQRETDAELPPEQERVPIWVSISARKCTDCALDQLREVARVAHVRRVPGAPAGVAGLVNLRGEILCALDVRAILGLPPKTSAEPPFLVALRGFGDPLGLIVDSIADIYSLAASDIEAPPSTWPAERAACFIGTARVPAGLMGLLDLARITKL